MRLHSERLVGYISESRVFISISRSMFKSIHHAKYILVEPGNILQNAAVCISDSGCISSIESWSGLSPKNSAEIMDWGSAVIIPGLINAHAHLELTSLHNQLIHFSSFTDWISQLVARRQSWTKEDFISSAREGARLALASGTVLVGDITSSGFGWDSTLSEHLRRVVFEEVLALSPDQADQALLQLGLLFERAKPNPLLIHGISPHAPYSVSAELFRRIAVMAKEQGRLLATHVAETREELQFLQKGTGELRYFLEKRGVLPGNWNPPKSDPIPYLQSLNVLGRSCLLIHCNYLDEKSIFMIKKTGSSVVYCPRSHDFFGHEEHPVRQLLNSGVNVALGTDSLASNSSLSMIDETRYLFKKRKDIKAEEIFHAATSCGAAAFGLEDTLGCLKKNYWADMAVIQIPDNLTVRHMLSQILEGAGECIATVVQGRIAWQDTVPGRKNS
jgi:aminodeoxyfutalosine deaminase